MSRVVAILIGCAVLLLAGCAPDTNNAEHACYQYISERWLAENPGKESDEVSFMLNGFRETCAADAKADPEGFIEIWGD